MSLEIAHVLIDVDDLGAVLLENLHKAVDQLGELREALHNECLILLVLSPNMSKKLLEVLRIVHYKLVDDCLVKVNTGELIGIALNNNCRHCGEVLRDYYSASFHDKQILRLYFLKESHVGVDVRNQRLETNV